MSLRLRARRAVVALAAATLVILPATAASAAGAGETEVVIVHGVPNLTVDILVNGAPALTSVDFGDVAKVILPSATYKVDIVAAGTTGPAVLSGSFALKSRTSVTLAAHLKADGSPTLAAYVNQRGATGIQPFHLAAFPAVDILAGGSTALSGVTNGVTARIDVPGGTTVNAVGIAAAGSTTAALPIGDVTVPEGVLVLAYAIGDASTLRVVTEVIPVIPTPTGVPSGEGGLAEPMAPFVALLLAVGMAAAVLVPVARSGRR
jgi:hypothetical protein